MMISISSRSRLVAAASPFAVAVVLASTPAWAEGAGSPSFDAEKRVRRSSVASMTVTAP